MLHFLASCKGPQAPEPLNPQRIVASVRYGEHTQCRDSLNDKFKTSLTDSLSLSLASSCPISSSYFDGG